MPFDPPLSIDEVQKVFTGTFTILEMLAPGGQGYVFRASGPSESGKSPVSVALKIYSEDQAEERSLREVTALKQLRCERIVRFHAAGSCRVRGTNCRYIATEFVEGESLTRAILKSPIAIPYVVRIAIDLATAIAALWEVRIVHRDVKPANVIRVPSGASVLIDLGIARHQSLSAITTIGKAWGTPGYMSPEQAEAKRSLTCKSDIFSLGVLLQESLVGRHPTNGQQHLLKDGGVRTERLLKNLPAQLIAMINAMLNRSAVFRPTPAKVIKELERLAQ